MQQKMLMIWNLTSELLKYRQTFWKGPWSGNKTFETVFLLILFLPSIPSRYITRESGAVRMEYNDGNCFWSRCVSPRYGNDKCLLHSLPCAVFIISFSFYLLFYLHVLDISSALRFINFFKFYNTMPDTNQYSPLLGLDNSAKSFHSLLLAPCGMTTNCISMTTFISKII